MNLIKGVGLACVSCILLVGKVSAQIDMTSLCFDLGIPTNGTSTLFLDADDNAQLNQTIGTLQYQVEYLDSSTGSFVPAGDVTYSLITDGSGFLIDNSDTYCADFGGVIENVFEIRIGMTVNAGEWQAAGVGPWTLDNVTLLNGSDPLIAWDYATDANASFVDPLITSSGGLDDAWSGDLISPVVTNGALEFTFPEGGGGGGGFIYNVATIPEPSSLFLFAVAGLGCLMRRR